MSWLDGEWAQIIGHRREGVRSRAQSHSTCIVFGAGVFGRRVRADLVALGFTVVAFADNDLRKVGRTIDGLPVIAPATAVLKDEALWVLGVYTNAEMREQCGELGMSYLTFPELAWAFPELLPYYALDLPENVLAEFDTILRTDRLWHDEQSRSEFRTQVAWRLTLDYRLLSAATPGGVDYLPADIARPSAREVVVDCGAFQGDTLDLMMPVLASDRGRVIAIEPDSVNVGVLRDKLRGWDSSVRDRVIVHEVALGERPGSASFDATGTVSSRTGEGRQAVLVDTLDRLLRLEEPTYIKMDIEGAEQAALRGAATTIRRCRPVIAVCLYHRPTDLWAIPELLASLVPEYSLHLRRYSDECWETVCFAVPPERAP